MYRGFETVKTPANNIVPIALLSLDRVQTDSGGDLLTLRHCMYSHTHSKSMDQSKEAANPAHGQLNREDELFPVPVRV